MHVALSCILSDASDNYNFSTQELSMCDLQVHINIITLRAAKWESPEGHRRQRMSSSWTITCKSAYTRFIPRVREWCLTQRCKAVDYCHPTIPVSILSIANRFTFYWITVFKINFVDFLFFIKYLRQNIIIQVLNMFIIKNDTLLQKCTRVIWNTWAGRGFRTPLP